MQTISCTAILEQDIDTSITPLDDGNLILQIDIGTSTLSQNISTSMMPLDDGKSSTLPVVYKSILSILFVKNTVESGQTTSRTNRTFHLSYSNDDGKHLKRIPNNILLQLV